jgi:hypothetical protein
MKNYWISFGASDPRTYTGLSPTFIMYFNQLGSTLSPPGITEILVGSGFYRFQASIGWSQSVAFLVDGGASASSARYVRGTLDSSDSLDLTIGYTASSFGDTLVEPGDIFGSVKRNRENLEGNSGFLKSSGQWSIYSRGFSTLLTVKTLTQDTTGITKS